MKNKGQISITLNAKIYPIESILGATYAFLERAYIFLDGDPEKKIRVDLMLKNGIKGFDEESLKGEFLNELVTQNLRLKLAKENRKLQEYIVGQALFSATPQRASQDDEIDRMLESELKALEEKERKLVRSKKNTKGKKKE